MSNEFRKHIFGECNKSNISNINAKEQSYIHTHIYNNSSNHNHNFYRIKHNHMHHKGFYTIHIIVQSLLITGTWNSPLAWTQDTSPSASHEFYVISITVSQIISHLVGLRFSPCIYLGHISTSGLRVSWDIYYRFTNHFLPHLLGILPTQTWDIS